MNKRFLVLLFLSVLLALSFVSGVQAACEYKLIASDGAANDIFGYSVAIAGDYALVGAYLGDGNAAGSAYIYDIVDTIPPKITCPPAVTVNTNPGVCYAIGVALGSPIVSDNCDPAPTVTNNAPAGFFKGTTTVTWTATDASGNSATCTQTVTVKDNQAPAMTVTASPNTLKSPNHQYVDVTATVTVKDNCDPSPPVTLVSVTSNEPDDAPGATDGKTVNDIVILDKYHFKLRAERDSKGTGRIYTITYKVSDTSGNSALASATVKVPLGKP